MLLMLAILIGLFLAYANGANDNFKGVATLFGSGTADYKRALAWATVTTVLGSLAALFVSQGLIAAFSGKGLVPDAVGAMKNFTLSVGLAAAVTVMLATRLGLPISTTHALIGALVGAGLIASADGVNGTKLVSTFLFPLFASPLLAILATLAVYPTLRLLRHGLGIRKESCLCVGNEIVGVVPPGVSPEQALAMLRLPSLSTGTSLACRDRYQGEMLGITAATALDQLHYFSAGMVSFARGLNDTPKIAAILLVGQAVSPPIAIVAVTLAIAGGGFLSARKVADTMGLRVTPMNHGQGFAANLVTGVLVIAASRFGLPVSTTHVSCGALFGIGTLTGKARWKTVAGILLAWVTTLPLAALLGAGLFYLLRGTTI